VGVIKDLTGNFSVALIVLAVAAFLAALIAFLLPDRAAPSPAKTALRADPAQ
jgi:cyanate permease